MISNLLHPDSIAVVGASNDVRKLRGMLLHTLLLGKFPGAIYPVNPGYEEIQGLKAYASLDDLPAVPDLALLVVPGAVAPQEIEKAAARGVKAAIVYSSDADPDALTQAIGASGLRLMGPNTEGLFIPKARLAPTFAHSVAEVLMHPGPHRNARRSVSIVSQSGGQGFALFGRGLAEKLDFHSVIATGNEVDLDCLDFVEHLVRDGEAGVILMFIEGLKRPERFARVAALAADRGVPLVVLKVGSSEAGRRAAISHTAHLAGTDTAYDALFRRYGVIRVADPEEMLAAAAAFSRLPLVTRANTAIITSSGGAGAWAAELCSARGLAVPMLNPGLQQKIASLIPSFGSAVNPIDVTAQAVEDGGAALAQVLATVVADDQIDAVIVNMGLGVKGRVKGLRPVYEPLFAQSQKPLLFHSHIIPSEENLEELADFGAHGFPSFRACAFALHALSAYGRFQQQCHASRANAQAAREPPSMPHFDVDEEAGGVLGEHATRSMLERFGVPTPPSRLASSSEGALAAARALGFPVVLKIQSRSISHKTEAGGVELNVSEADVEQAYARITANALRHAPNASIQGVLVQKQMPAGHEVVIGIVTDPDFGPLIMFGLGGIYVEILKDVAFAPPPIDRDEALRMIGSLKASPILFGARGRPAADVDALADLLMRVSDMAVAGQDTIDQLDLNPVFVYPKGQGLVAVDALIAVHQRA